MLSQTFTIDPDQTGQRLDKFLLSQNLSLSRNFCQKLIKDRQVRINKKLVTKNGQILRAKDEVLLIIPTAKPLEIKAQDIPLDIIFENKDYLVINKQPNIVVHPSAQGQHQDNSIVNAILAHCPNDLSGIGGVLRPGIVHRLDKDTSGALIIAKNDPTHQYFSNIIKNRQIKKEYICLVKGRLEPTNGRIEAPIGRSLHNRQKMAVSNSHNHRMSVTEYQVKKYFTDSTLVNINLITGRTHQIRVHLQSIGHPVIGDKLYGDSQINKVYTQKYNLKRQFLHAAKLTFIPPNTTKKKSFLALLPKDLSNIITP